MSKGYIVIAQNNATVDYLQQAYALALNLKLTQSEVNKLTVCVDKATKRLITDKHRQVFDCIVDIPWIDDAENSDWKIQNKWRYEGEVRGEPHMCIYVCATKEGRTIPVCERELSERSAKSQRGRDQWIRG